MAVMNVNPTRMQLSKLKKQLVTAVRGHKMLKDKRDELMRRFLDLVRQTRDLRDKVERDVRQFAWEELDMVPVIREAFGIKD